MLMRRKALNEQRHAAVVEDASQVRLVDAEGLDNLVQRGERPMLAVNRRLDRPEQHGGDPHVLADDPGHHAHIVLLAALAFLEFLDDLGLRRQLEVALHQPFDHLGIQLLLCLSAIHRPPPGRMSRA